MPYRADIDGLRAVSVVAVVLYHAGVPLAGGGYVGVDVFFVISGFLITSLILHEQAAGAFSLTDFYHRRIRRILPALFAMMAASAAAGWFLLAPADYVKLGRSIVSATLSVSNLYFWRDADYFDTPAAEKPLLHTWSLGVEEQFYLVFPLFLILVARHLPRGRLALTALLCAASFAAGAAGAFRDPLAAFYLPHARLWELMVGALLAMGALPIPSSARLRGGAALLGLGLIALPVLVYAHDTIFPGLAALPPALGAALVIWSGMGGTSGTGRILAASPLVFLGKISYSLYLWHFPLLAFGFYLTLGDLGPLDTAILLGIALVLSMLSWRFIEQPARRAGARLSWRRVAIAASAGALVLALTGLATQLTGGFPARLGEEAQRQIAGGPLRNPDRAGCFVRSGRIAVSDLCIIGDAAAAPSFVLWGDSHAETLRGALGTAAAAVGRSGLFAGQTACPPLIGAIRPQKPDCRIINEALFRMILETPSIDTVVMAARWGWWAESRPYKREGGTPVTLALLPPAYAADGNNHLPPADGGNHLAFANGGNHAALATGLEHTVVALLAAGKRVWLVGPVPEIGYDVPRYVHLRALGLARGLEIAPTLAEFRERQGFVLALVDDLAQRYPIGVVRPHQLLCNEARCAIMREGRLLYSDDDHLSVFGAQSIAPHFAPVFDSALRSTKR